MTPGGAELRFIPEIRSAHFERTRRTFDQSILYIKEYADLDPRSLVDHDTRKVGVWTAWTWAFRGRRRVVELPEPLWLRALPFTLSVGLAFRLADLLHRRRTLIGTYAMENNSAERLFRPLPPAARRAVAAVIRWLSGIIYDRVAFASTAAAACYRDAGVLPASVSTRDFVELLPPCPCPVDRADPRRAGTVVFLGALEARKGVPDLLAAWDLLPAARNGWTLRVAGTGPCADEVRRAAAANGTIVHIGSADRESVHVMLRAAAVLVLPSRPEGRWIEQIGLPIVEGLAHGCRIVATPDTGLAPWLRENGHVVLADDFTVPELADALSDALGRPGAVADDALPTEDVRLVAHDWLLDADPDDLSAARAPSRSTHDVPARKEGT